jgi:uncharacterized protein YkwD
LVAGARAILPAAAGAALAAALSSGAVAGGAPPAQRLAERVNVVRAERGHPRLTISAELTRAAAAHARAMARAGFFGHSDADGTPFWKRIVRYYPVAGYRRWRVGEDLFWAPDPPTTAQIVREWLASPPHRRVLLGDWRQVGVALVTARDAPGFFGGRDATVVVADFGNRSR